MVHNLYNFFPQDCSPAKLWRVKWNRSGFFFEHHFGTRLCSRVPVAWVFIRSLLNKLWVLGQIFEFWSDLLLNKSSGNLSFGADLGLSFEILEFFWAWVFSILFKKKLLLVQACRFAVDTATQGLSISEKLSFRKMLEFLAKFLEFFWGRFLVWRHCYYVKVAEIFRKIEFLRKFLEF